MTFGPNGLRPSTSRCSAGSWSTKLAGSSNAATREGVPSCGAANTPPRAMPKLATRSPRMTRTSSSAHSRDFTLVTLSGLTNFALCRRPGAPMSKISRSCVGEAGRLRMIPEYSILPGSQVPSVASPPAEAASATEQGAEAPERDEQMLPLVPSPVGATSKRGTTVRLSAKEAPTRLATWARQRSPSPPLPPNLLLLRRRSTAGDAHAADAADGADAAAATMRAKITRTKNKKTKPWPLGH
mmetsp:Transcript_74836/g.243022  ORF Transcript_74836/g.243022 Transcript_74836/m.243022 type:complete len:241 (+) Transcript_74836:382-1104(+)